ncbi:MAG: hypothetical protein JNK74_27710 [Candidatus Hydrogenedentes bacterium]|nr:hypothetical protein [Candidatus Hydrogenedentota bacterium]
MEIVLMHQNTRREFMSNIGRGMLLAGLGSTLAADLGLASAAAGEIESTLNFGALEPLVALMRETPPERLNAILIEKLKSGASLKSLVAAGALANARTFGGQDYIGFHTFMALAPAWHMARSLPIAEQPLPVLKVLYRNANRIQEFGGRASEVLHPLTADPIPAGAHAGEYLQTASRSGDVEHADRVFASLASGPVGEAFNHLQFAVEDEVDVHRVVLAWRAWDTMELAGEEWGHCLLRQSIRYCTKVEHDMNVRGHQHSPIREVLPRLLDDYKLLEKPRGQNLGDDAWALALANTIFQGAREEAAQATANALAEGFAPESIGEAISLAANMLALHDPGRPEQWANADKPAGSCHGDSVGVHASDAANAWRNIVRVSDARNATASLIVGAFHTAGQSERSNAEPFPFAEQLEKVKADQPEALLAEAEACILAKDQDQTAAAVARYGQLGHAPGPVFDLMRKFATSEDGALHAEKYFRTAGAEFDATRPAYRWGQLVALARVTASEYGHPAPGFEEAKALLKV